MEFKLTLTVSIEILVAARLADADLVEWGVKILLIPADFNLVFIRTSKVSCEAIL